MKVRTEIVPIETIKVNLFVRTGLNENHAYFLAELMENGIKLPPIKVTRDGVIIDGRHRYEAHGLNLKKEIEVEYVDVENEIELISQAYKANMGGSLPPSPQDTEHTIMLLLERGENRKHIAELLGLPLGMARRFVGEVQSKMARTKLLRAVSAVTDGGLTVAKAAEQYGVDPEKLREVLSGRRRKHKQGIADMQRQLTSTYKSLAAKNSSTLRRILEKFEDGDVTEKQMRDIFGHYKALQHKADCVIADWEKRFEAQSSKSESV